MTKWWKCDLQVATPAWNFRMPPGETWDTTNPDGIDAFADRYMRELASKGIEVIVLADHNTYLWIDPMKAAGDRHGIVVFPGCEVTSSSGADGIHLQIVGDRTASGAEFDLLLGGALGYNPPNSPRFINSLGGPVPGSSSKTVTQILDDLPDQYLALAPHALGDNGIASQTTAVGDIRWKAIHHHRLNAMDPGDCADPRGDAWNARFRRRELDDFPRLKEIAYVSTSDAYSIADLGSRFTWIRMYEPTLEALRQAFLDRDARILCDWDTRLDGYLERDPNRIQHAWIESVQLGGLGNSVDELVVSFDPRLNTLIGGRGSGKSTIVAALRQLFSGVTTLPNGIRTEAEGFAIDVFAESTLTARYRIQNSQEEQTAVWSAQDGSIVHTAAGDIPTSFRVRVVSQKELFARVSHDRNDEFGVSRSLLSFVDEGLALVRQEPLAADSWWRRLEAAQARWTELARRCRAIEADVGALPGLGHRIRELEAQVAAFDSPAAQERRRRNDEIIDEQRELEAAALNVEEVIGDLLAIADEEIPLLPPGGAGGEAGGLSVIADAIQGGTRDVASQANQSLQGWRDRLILSEWPSTVAGAMADSALYLAELQEQGIDPAAYSEVRDQLAELMQLEGTLRHHAVELAELTMQRNGAWDDLSSVVTIRRERRQDLLDVVMSKNPRLRFNLRTSRDTTGWTLEVRELLNLRADGFLEDVPRLAEWIWANDDDDGLHRRQIWRDALVSGSIRDLTTVFPDDHPFRQGWLQKLEQLDESIRLRLAVQFADDALNMQFLRDGADEADPDGWQDVTQGSPGQRTAAMLAFVLHHGSEPLVLDQPEDDLDTEWISNLVVRELRASRSKRQVIVATHNANIPVNGDAESVIVLENEAGAIRLRTTFGTDGLATPHVGPIEVALVREDIQNIMEGGIPAFVQRERKYNNELRAAAGWYADHRGRT